MFTSGILAPAKSPVVIVTKNSVNSITQSWPFSLFTIWKGTHLAPLNGTLGMPRNLAHKHGFHVRNAYSGISMSMTRLVTSDRSRQPNNSTYQGSLFPSLSVHAEDSQGYPELDPCTAECFDPGSIEVAALLVHPWACDLAIASHTYHQANIDKCAVHGCYRYYETEVCSTGKHHWCFCCCQYVCYLIRHWSMDTHCLRGTRGK